MELIIPSPAKIFSQRKTNLKNGSRLSYRLLLLFSLNLAMAPLLADEPAVLRPGGIAGEITEIISAKQHPYLIKPNFTHRAEDLDNLYKLTNYQPLWLTPDGAEKNMTAALNLLANASIHGLNPVNYDSEMLLRNRPPASGLKPQSEKIMALYDTALSLSLLRFIHDLHYGRVNPQGINFKLKLRGKKSLDLPVLIRNSVDQRTVAHLPEQVEPKLMQYQKLKQALAVYRRLASQSPGFVLQIKKPLRPGDRHPQLEELSKFLIALGDLPDDGLKETEAGKPTPYTRQLAAGVKRFQYRHGLGADGIIGKGTAAAINAPLDQRITQIELAMERLRWLPEFNFGPAIIVNIPAFQLWAFDDISKNNPEILNMKVVVGKALKNQTPVLMAEMSFIDFMPYWNLPYSIVKDEILPKLLTDPSYLDQENMEIVPGFSNEAQAVALTPAALIQLKQGSLKIRQRPGKKNALGRVKFMFPNKEDVYLHDTPANALFSKSRRDFSHGCVRVENPEGLANFALKDQPDWNSEAIELAMKTQKTRRVILKKSIPVLFFYTTSFFDQGGNLMFYQDIYGHDEVLLDALKKPEDMSDQSLFVSNNREHGAGNKIR